jgi:hypothetical protein
MELKQSSFDPKILTPHNLTVGIIESQDSTPKKLIYQFPFSQTPLMAQTIKDLENRFLTNVHLDVEVNSLEDAYINIAREEEKLLQNQSPHNPEAKPHLDEEAFKRFKSCTPRPSFCNQMTATFKRRLVCFLNQPRELTMAISPIFNCLILLATVNVLINQLLKGDADS